MAPSTQYPIESDQIFISYSRADDLFVNELRDKLTIRGYRLWQDTNNLRVGDKWQQEINVALQKCSHMILVLSPEALRSGNVRYEIETFRDIHSTGAIFAVICKECEKLPYDLEEYQYIRSDGQDVVAVVNALSKKLKPPDDFNAAPEWLVNTPASENLRNAVHGVISITAQRLQVNVNEIVVTLYGLSFPDEKGPGKFEYDLLYHWNLYDPTFMFGPIIPGDTRTITGQKENWYEISLKPNGGFYTREGLNSAGWFKLGGYREEQEEYAEEECIECMWGEEIPTPPAANFKGLLFINTRTNKLNERLVEDRDFRLALRQLEEMLIPVIKSRQKQHGQRNQQVGGAEYDNINKEYKEINQTCAAMMEIFQRITKKDNLAFTIFAFNPSRKSLVWLWSNGPTSVDATMKVSMDAQKYPSQPNLTNLLVVQVASDYPRYRPRLVNFRGEDAINGISIRTRYRSNVRSNLVIPILTAPSSSSGGQGNDNPKLLGIIDMQTSGIDFDTDDVQLAYKLLKPFLSYLKKNKALVISPLLEADSDTRSLQGPIIHKIPLGFDSNDLRTLNFNPMKYLFHWGKIRQLITIGEVDFPSLIEVWPSMDCNHNCIWCRTKGAREGYTDSSQYIPAEGLNQLAADLVQQGDHVDLLISGGGEPLLHPDIHTFAEKLGAANHLGTVGIFTNGTRPQDFSFWTHFFNLKSTHSFVRVSFNGHDPHTYSHVHFSDPNADYAVSKERYAEARKIVLDLLAMRSEKTTVAIGSTIAKKWISTIEEQISHAKRVGVDFIQIRPELEQSAKENFNWRQIRDTVDKEQLRWGDAHFAAVYTDGERAYKNHDYDICYAMYLVPTITPSDDDVDWLTVYPCSYAMSVDRIPPQLGQMRVGTSLSDFWKALSRSLKKQGPAPDATVIRGLLDTPIDPKPCPQCRYFMLNKRIIALKALVEADPIAIQLLDALVQELNQLNDGQQISVALKQSIENLKLPEDVSKIGIQMKDVINIEDAQKAFWRAAAIGIRPSL